MTNTALQDRCDLPTAHFANLQILDSRPTKKSDLRALIKSYYQSADPRPIQVKIPDELHDIINQCKTIALFFENTQWLEPTLQTSHLSQTLVYPNWQSSDELKFYKNAPHSATELNGCLMSSNKNSCAKPDFLFIPAMAVSIDSKRLGRGKGHYDKYLAKHPNTPVCVVVKDEFIYKSFRQIEDFTELDKPIHYILSEKRFIKLNTTTQLNSKETSP